MSAWMALWGTTRKIFAVESRHAVRVLFLILGVSLVVLPGLAWSQVTTRVSVSSLGDEGNNGSFSSSISGDGRFVAFESFASNLVSGDTNGESDVFVHDRQTSQTVRISVSSGGLEGNGRSLRPSISEDGQFVAFESWADNLVPGDNNGVGDIFVHDRQTGETVRVSESSDGTEGNDWSEYPSISADGRFVAFASWADDLVAGDTNNGRDVFVHDRSTGMTTRVNVTSGGDETSGQWSSPTSVSPDGRFVVFTSDGSDLVPGDTNGVDDVFVHDRTTGETTRVSVGAGGVQGNWHSKGGSISGDGRFVVFKSWADNLVQGDDNDTPDIFLHDRQTGATTMISGFRTAANAAAVPEGFVISRDGTTIAFDLVAPNYWEAPPVSDGVFVYHRSTGALWLISVDWLGQAQGGFSPSISSDGAFVSFWSGQALASTDTNADGDVYVHGPIVFAQGTGGVVAAPAITGWGMLVFTVLAALGALYVLRRRAFIQ